MLNICDLEIKNIMMLNLEIDLYTLDKYLLSLKTPPVGLYVSNKRKPFTYEENGLIVHPYNTLLDLNNIPNNLESNIIDRKGNLIISGYNLHYHNTSFSNSPFLAVMSLDFLQTLVDHLQYNNNKYRNLYFENNLIADSDYLIDAIVKKFTFVEDIVLYYFNGLTKKDLDAVTDIVYNRIIPLINEYMLMDTTALYTLDMTGPDIILYKYNDIRAIRYEEAVDKVNFINTLEKNFEENI